VQIGMSTNWIKVWAGLLETVAMQSDGSLWYWGENPDPNFAQGTNQIFAPKQISPDTNWVDVGFGVNTVFAIKSDGTLWTWGRQADRYTGANDTAQNAIPTRIGTNSDWRSICDTAGWWCNGLVKKDGSLWFMDASEGKPNGPRTPYQLVQFRQIQFQKDYVAYAAGATHAAAPGVHGPIGVILTRDGEVWTWGMVLGDPSNFKSSLLKLGVSLARRIHPSKQVGDPEPDPVYRDELWQLRNIDSN
jgi:alpha-tubulin suppressor-like RCC1 family protein